MKIVKEFLVILMTGDDAFLLGELDELENGQ